MIKTLLQVLGLYVTVCFPNFQIFVDLFCTNLQGPVWSCHVGVPPRSANQHLELTFTI